MGHDTCEKSHETLRNFNSRPQFCIWQVVMEPLRPMATWICSLVECGDGRTHGSQAGKDVRKGSVNLSIPTTGE